LDVVGLNVVLQTLVKTLGVRNELKKRTGQVSIAMAAGDDASRNSLLTYNSPTTKGSVDIEED